jgi:uncharacterized protein (DUF1800 family)
VLKRYILPLLPIAIVAVALNSNAQNQTIAVAASDSQIVHALQRLTFGPRAGDIEVVRKVGLQNWMQSQLHPESIPESAALDERLKPLASLRMNLVESMANNAARSYSVGGSTLRLVNNGDSQAASVSQALLEVFNAGNIQVGARNNMAAPLRTPEMDLKDGRLLRAVYSNRQLEEVLVDFWFNHFNVTTAKGGPFIADYEREAIRPYVLGKFKDMLAATALHPAMLLYLDNKASIAPEIAQPNGPNMTISFASARGLNENFSRELMELHTLGVDGGYTQQDIEAAARCFTGWNLVQNAGSAVARQEPMVDVEFVQWPHDPKDKLVLGHTIHGSGSDEVYELFDILASHPSTARHISKQLAERFVSDNPPQSLVDRMAKTFMDTDGDLREVMSTMLTSTEFLAAGAQQSKIKSPLELVSSALRALDVEIKDPASLEQWIADMGQPLYGKIEPTGYPNTGESWLSTARLLVRLNFASNLAAGKIPGITVVSDHWNGKDTLQIAREILARDPSPQTAEALRKSNAAGDTTPAFIGGLVLGSPDFQKK